MSNMTAKGNCGMNHGDVVSPTKVAKVEAIKAVGRKRMNGGEARPMKVVKVETIKAVELPIGVGRKTGRKRMSSGEVISPSEGVKVEAIKAAELPIGVGRSTGSNRMNSGEARPMKVVKVETIKAAELPIGVGRKSGRKRMNSGDASPMKVVKVETIKAAELPIGVGRKTGRKRMNSGEVISPMKFAKVEAIKVAELPAGVGWNTGRKQMISGKVISPSEGAKVEAIKAAELPIGVGRNTGCSYWTYMYTDNKAEEAQKEDLKKLNECGQDTHTGDKLVAKKASADDELNNLHKGTSFKAEVACIDEINMLRKMLKEDPKNLDEKDQDRMIQYLTIEEITSLALESGEGKGSDDDIEEHNNLGGNRMLMHRMLDHPEKLKKAEFCLLYTIFDYNDFARLALNALEINQQRLLLSEFADDLYPDEDLYRDKELELKLSNPLKSEQSDMLPSLCRVLPPKLFDHIFSAMSGLHLFGSAPEEPDEDCDKSSKKVEEKVTQPNEECEKAAQDCRICLGKGGHSGRYGSFCSFTQFVPKGATVGPGYCVVCRNCGLDNEYPVDECWMCGSQGGVAIRV